MCIASKIPFALTFIAALTIHTAIAGAASFNIRLVQNDAPGPTLLSCKISVEADVVEFQSSGFRRLLHEMIWERNHEITKKFENHVLTLEDRLLAKNLLTIAKHFELCHEGSNMKIVDGGTITEIECVMNPKEAARKAHYIAQDQSNRRANLMEDISRDVQVMVVSDVQGENGAKDKARDALKNRCDKLASNIERYTQAFSLLEDAYKEGSPVDWTKVTELVRFRPGQPPLEKRTRLVRTAHDVLTASCSMRELQNIVGINHADAGAMILRIGGARRCRGSFSIPDNPDWGFDDVETSLGLTYPPNDSALPVGILDVGLERLLLHFLLREVSKAPTSYDRFSLATSGTDWKVIERWSFKKEPIPKETRGRLQYISTKSGLLAYLLNGKVPEHVLFLEVNAIAIEDDHWNAARLDYRIGDEEMILPLFFTDGTWRANHPWTERAYRNIGNIIENSAFFRSRAEVEKHNAEQ